MLSLDLTMIVANFVIDLVRKPDRMEMINTDVRASKENLLRNRRENLEFWYIDQVDLGHWL